MANLIVADCPNLECAVLIDTDELRALPIVAAGPDRDALLQAFVDSVPFDITLLEADASLAAFGQFLERSGRLSGVAPNTSAPNPMEPPAGSGTDAEAALAETEATHAGDVPAPQPADTDQTEDSAPTPVEADCFNCNGTGRIEFGDDQPGVRCNVCAGTGRVQTMVPS